MSDKKKDYCTQTDYEIYSDSSSSCEPSHHNKEDTDCFIYKKKMIYNYLIVILINY